MDIELGSAKGYRGWDIDYWPDKPPMLTSMFGSPWPYGIIEASCNHSTDHKAPLKDCTCGIYATKIYKDNTTMFAYSSFCIEGYVELFGHVIEHEKGYRAQYARVLSLGNYGIDSLMYYVHIYRDDYLVIKGCRITREGIRQPTGYALSLVSLRHPKYVVRNMVGTNEIMPKEEFLKVIGILRELYIE